MSLLTAQLRTSLGVPGMPLLLFGRDGWGVTLDDRMIDEFDADADGGGAGRDALLARQFAIAEHLPSLSELDTE